MADSFSATVGAWVSKSMIKATAVFKQSAQEVFAEAQTDKGHGGFMPVDTGYLRNTFVSGLNGSNDFVGPDAYVMAIVGAGLSDEIFGGWTAKYALVQEYGSSEQVGNFYMGRAAANWQSIVKKNADHIR